MITDYDQPKNDFWKLSPKDINIDFVSVGTILGHSQRSLGGTYYDEKNTRDIQVS